MITLKIYYIETRTCLLNLTKVLENSIDTTEIEIKKNEIRNKVNMYSKAISKLLSLIFGVHGTDEETFVGMVEYYEFMNQHLTFINELFSS